jgi:hypothetical protein
MDIIIQFAQKQKMLYILGMMLAVISWEILVASYVYQHSLEQAFGSNYFWMPMIVFLASIAVSIGTWDYKPYWNEKKWYFDYSDAPGYVSRGFSTVFMIPVTIGTVYVIYTVIRNYFF